jgi:type I restriction enzyme R subunit
MAAKEAKARIKLNKLLEESGWCFFDHAAGKANIVLEPKVKLTKSAIDALGENFEQASNGFIEFPAIRALFDAFVQAHQAETK